MQLTLAFVFETEEDHRRVREWAERVYAKSPWTMIIPQKSGYRFLLRVETRNAAEAQALVTRVDRRDHNQD